MFECAITAATEAARTWTTETPDPVEGPGCCRLCFGEFRMLVLDGPLRSLPHGVVHAAVLAVSSVIADRIAGAPAPHRSEGTTRRSKDGHAAAVGGLLLMALQELGAADARLTQLQRRYTDPALVEYLERARDDEVPTAWL